MDTGHADRTWAIWAAVGYGVTTLIFWLTRHKNVPLILPMLVSLAGALAAPVTWLATRVAPTAEVQVISQSALLLLQHGTPVPAGRGSWTPGCPTTRTCRSWRCSGCRRRWARPACSATRGCG